MVSLLWMLLALLGCTDAAMVLTSKEFKDNETIPGDFGCDIITGLDRSTIMPSPPLEWVRVPAKTRSFVLMMDDMDNDNAVLWLTVNIPLANTTLEAGASNMTMPEGSYEFNNSYGYPGYSGPCPNGTNNLYRFRVFAMQVESVELNVVPDKNGIIRSDDITNQLVDDSLYCAPLYGYYYAPPPVVTTVIPSTTTEGVSVSGIIIPVQRYIKPSEGYKPALPQDPAVARLYEAPEPKADCGSNHTETAAGPQVRPHLAQVVRSYTPQVKLTGPPPAPDPPPLPMPARVSQYDNRNHRHHTPDEGYSNDNALSKPAAKFRSMDETVIDRPPSLNEEDNGAGESIPGNASDTGYVFAPGYTDNNTNIITSNRDDPSSIPPKPASVAMPAAAPAMAGETSMYPSLEDTGVLSPDQHAAMGGDYFAKFGMKEKEVPYVDRNTHIDALTADMPLDKLISPGTVPLSPRLMLAATHAQPTDQRGMQFMLQAGSSRGAGAKERQEQRQRQQRAASMPAHHNYHNYVHEHTPDAMNFLQLGSATGLTLSAGRAAAVGDPEDDGLDESDAEGLADDDADRVADGEMEPQVHQGDELTWDNDEALDSVMPIGQSLLQTGALQSGSKGSWVHPAIPVDATLQIGGSNTDKYAFEGGPSVKEVAKDDEWMEQNEEELNRRLELDPNGHYNEQGVWTGPDKEEQKLLDANLDRVEVPEHTPGLTEPQDLTAMDLDDADMSLLQLFTTTATTTMSSTATTTMSSADARASATADTAMQASAEAEKEAADDQWMQEDEAQLDREEAVGTLDAQPTDEVWLGEDEAKLMAKMDTPDPEADLNGDEPADTADAADNDDAADDNVEAEEEVEGVPGEDSSVADEGAADDAVDSSEDAGSDDSAAFLQVSQAIAEAKAPASTDRTADMDASLQPLPDAAQEATDDKEMGEDEAQLAREEYADTHDPRDAEDDKEMAADEARLAAASFTEAAHEGKDDENTWLHDSPQDDDLAEMEAADRAEASALVQTDAGSVTTTGGADDAPQEASDEAVVQDTIVFMELWLGGDIAVADGAVVSDQEPEQDQTGSGKDYNSYQHPALHIGRHLEPVDGPNPCLACSDEDKPPPPKSCKCPKYDKPPVIKQYSLTGWVPGEPAMSLPDRFVCPTGEHVTTIPFAWRHVPAGTQSVMILMDEVTDEGRSAQPYGKITWLVTGIAPTESMLNEMNLPVGSDTTAWLPSGAQQVIKYKAPCPIENIGSKGRYRLRVMALPTDAPVFDFPLGVEEANSAQIEEQVMQCCRPLMTAAVELGSNMTTSHVHQVRAVQQARAEAKRAELRSKIKPSMSGGGSGVLVEKEPEVGSTVDAGVESNEGAAGALVSRHGKSSSSKL